MHYCNNQRYGRMTPRPECPTNELPCPCTGMSGPQTSCPVKDMEHTGTPCCGQLAMAGVNRQRSGSPTYDLQTAFTVGTIYKELNKPFTGKGGCR